MGLEGGIGAAFCNDTFTDVAYGLDVEVGSGTNQYVCPVVVAECNLLSWCKLQAAVGAEVNQYIGSEVVSAPKI